MAFTQNHSTVRKMWVKFQRIIRQPGRKKIFIALWITIVVVATILIYRYQAYRSYNLMVSNLRKKLVHYCNPPGPVLGLESQAPIEYAKFKLKQVQVVVRHGDRSPTAQKPIMANPYHFTCKLYSKNHHELQKIKQLREMEGVFRTKHMRSNGKHITEEFFVHEEIRCKIGQLTAKGYLQHIYLGEHMYRSYQRKLGISLATIEEEEILVFATRIERTQQSAAAFLSGMFYSIYKQMESPENFPVMKIQVSSDRLGLFREDENDDILPCPQLHEVVKRNRKTRTFQSGLAAAETLMQKFVHLFNSTRSKLPHVSSLADMVVTHHCHNHPPMCGPNGCIDNKLKAETMLAGDWAYTSNYTAGAIIRSHPILSKITQRMLLQASGEQHTKFVLFSTHDSTVIPVLESLGIFSKEWVPYTSRIVFELWEAGELLSNKLEDTDLEKHFVRILYNGKDYTSKVSICKSSLVFGKLCPLKSFITFLEDDTDSMEKKYSDLCRGKS